MMIDSLHSSKSNIVYIFIQNAVQKSKLISKIKILYTKKIQIHL